MSWQDLQARAKGRWPSILQQLGIDPKFLTKRDGPCPCCGGEDRFRFTDRDGSGMWFCRGCGGDGGAGGGGTGENLVMRFLSVNYAEAARRIEEVIGKAQVTYRAGDWRNESEKQREAMRHWWTTADYLTEECLGSTYLKSRMIDRRPLPDAVRFIKALPDRDPKSKVVTWRPALLSRYVAPDASRAALHCIFLSPFGEKADTWEVKRFMRGVHIVPGGAVRLAEPSAEMGVSTGIETSLAAMELKGLPVWAVLTDGMLLNFVPPGVCKRLHIFGDCDAKWSGQFSAYSLAYKLAHSRPDLEVKVHLPEIGKDFNDELVARKSASNVEELRRVAGG